MAGIPPRSLSVLRPAGGLPPRTGRDLAAVHETLTLLLRTLFIELSADPQVVSDTGRSLSIGGLRGGTLVFTDSGRTYLRDYSVVPGSR